MISCTHYIVCTALSFALFLIVILLLTNQNIYNRSHQWLLVIWWFTHNSVMTLDIRLAEISLQQPSLESSSKNTKMNEEKKYEWGKKYINFKIYKLPVNKYLLLFIINLLCLKHLLKFVSHEYADWFTNKTDNLLFRLICVTDSIFRSICVTDVESGSICIYVTYSISVTQINLNTYK